MACLSVYVPENSTGSLIYEDVLDDVLSQYLCPLCMKNVHLPSTGFCSLCGEPFSDITITPHACIKCASNGVEWDSYTFLAFHDGILRDLVIHAKFYASNSSLEFFGRISAVCFAYKQAEKLLLNNDFPDLIIPIPLHPKRLSERGYNQCTQIGRSFVRHLPSYLKLANNPTFLAEHEDALKKNNLDTKRLLRVKSTKTQTSLPQSERVKNVKGIFMANGVDGKKILLVDDVATTNSTLREACKSLKKQGAKRVDILVLTRACISK